MELLIIIPVIIAFIVLVVGTLWGSGIIRTSTKGDKRSKGDDHLVDDSDSGDSGNEGDGFDGGGGDASN